MLLHLHRFAIVLSCVVACVAACSSDPPTGAAALGDASASDGGVDGEDGGGESDAATDAGTLSPTKSTSVDVAVGGVSRTLARAQFGNSTSDGGGKGTLYIEAHEGGQPECPDQNSPSPKRTMIVAGVPRGASGEVFTKAADGIAVSFLDFTGDQLSGKPLTKATAASVTIVKIDGDTSVEIEVDATFPEGTAKGRVYATFCQSLSD